MGLEVVLQATTPEMNNPSVVLLLLRTCARSMHAMQYSTVCVVDLSAAYAMRARQHSTCCPADTSREVLNAGGISAQAP